MNQIFRLQWQDRGYHPVFKTTSCIQDTPIDAEEATRAFLQFMKGVGFQEQSIINAMEGLCQETEDSHGTV